MSITIDQAIEVYVKIRDDLGDKRAQFKETEKKYKEQMASIEDFLKTEADKLGVESFKTPEGTAYIDHPDFVQVVDWDAFLKFLSLSIAQQMVDDRVIPQLTEEMTSSIYRSSIWSFFSKSVNKDVVKAFMKDHQGMAPPGINYGQKEEMKVSRPTKSKKS